MKKRVFLRAAAVTAGLVLAIAFAFALGPVGRGREDRNTVQMQKGKQFHDVVQDQVFELQSHRRLPAGKRGKGGKGKKSVFNLG